MSERYGGPAFPVVYREWPGMSLRDWFATHAMSALLRRGWMGDEDDNGDPAPYLEAVLTDAKGQIGLPHLAKDAYLIADAMLAERSDD